MKHGNLRGVNLGGWLILEKWLTPSIFEGYDAHDEYEFMQQPGAKRRIERHRKTFVTEHDFAWLAKNGVNLVRIPIGYWVFESVDGYKPTVIYLDRALQWAEKHGIKVLIDLHGARGSQNGFDNSGKAGQAEWFTRSDYRNETIALLRRIAKRYGDAPALWGIELLNEPSPRGSLWTLLRFYRAAYRELRAVLRPGVYIVFHDGFRPLLFTGALWSRKSHPVMMDAHWYAFPIRSNDLEHYLRQSALRRKLLFAFLHLWQPIMIGEWSAVLPQRFFDATPKSEHMDLLRRNAIMQQSAYQHAAGWAYWNYKADGDGMWNFRDLVERGVINMKSDA